MTNLICSMLLACGLFWGVPNAHADDSSSPWTEVEQQVIARYPEISRPALDRAFSYLIANESLVQNKNYMTVIDFDQPSTAERMYVIDLNDITAKSYLVAHGKDSGDNYAISFSNEINSYKSSLGIYLTGEPYIGNDGLSMFLHGMESTNSNAEVREIVLHGAAYVSEDTIHALGRLGRSLGCPAVELQYVDELVQELSGGSVFLIYHSED